MNAAVGGVFALVLTLSVIVFAIMLIIAPIMIWHNVAKLRDEQREQMRLILSAIKSIERKLETNE